MADIVRKAVSDVSDVTVSDEQRVITGIASTPKPDRVGDIVKAEGAQFKLPFPLLANHDSRMPVGQVTALKATSKGLEFTAELAASNPDLPEVDRAWAQIKANLVKGVSIGFCVKECSLLPDMSGLLVEQYEIFELSLTPTPCNPDAKILTVKSLDEAKKAVEVFTEVETPAAVTDPAQAAVTETPVVKAARTVKLDLSFRKYQ